MDKEIVNFTIENWGVLATGATLVATAIFPPSSKVAKILPTALKLIYLGAKAISEWDIKKKK